MKKIKILFLGLLMIFAIQINSYAQGVHGITFHALYSFSGEDDYQEGNPINQIFSVSFSDEITLHYMLDENGIVEDSQIYKLIYYELIRDNDDILEIDIIIKSTITNDKYNYTFFIGDETEIMYIGNNVYKGVLSELKTIKR